MWRSEKRSTLLFRPFQGRLRNATLPRQSRHRRSHSGSFADGIAIRRSMWHPRIAPTKQHLYAIVANFECVKFRAASAKPKVPD